jgi:hypothetical protein
MMYRRRNGRHQLGNARSHHLDEPPAGYSLTSCAPAELASASPAGSHFAPKSFRCQDNFLCSAAVQDYNHKAGGGLVFRQQPPP